ncbi:phosphodiester glycosidase family protein [Streptomyces coryli]|nr:phosphodiester glycosidase family protein [Streptomyces coryli]
MDLGTRTRPVAPGVELTSFNRLESDKWLRANALSVDLGGSAKVDYLAGKVSERKTVADLAKEHDPGPGRRTVAALNADFFDINETGAPLGNGLRDGKPVQSPAAGAEDAVGIGPQSAGRILKLYFDGTITLPAGTRKLDSFNAANVPAGGIGAYTAQWGSADRALTSDGAAKVTEVAVKDGKVTSIADKPGSGEIPADTTVYIGRDAGADALAALQPGDPVSMEYHPRTDDNSEIPRTAVGGRGILVLDGEAQNWEGKPNNASAARTAVGFSKDGRTMHVLSVDGRSGDTGGVTLTELAIMLKQLGAYNALNLDGGGSSTLLAREPGTDTPQLENTPSDGFERDVPNGLAITAPDGSGKLKDLWVEPAADAKKAPTADQVPTGHPERVFPGLSRKLTAAGYDESYGPAPARPAWYSSRPDVGTMTGDGVFKARRGGTAKITARQGAASGSYELSVLDDLDRIRPTNDRVGLKDNKSDNTFGILGYDAHGASAPIDPADVKLDYDASLFDIKPDPAAGGFKVTAKTAEEFASGQVKATVAGKTTLLAVTVGLHEKPVATFDDAAQWKFTAARATGSVAPLAEGHAGTGLTMTYDFTQSTATRAGYANPPAEITVPGQPQSFGLWVKGDGKGAWPSLHLKDASGTTQVLRGPHIDWEGWKQVIFEVPKGIAYPLKVVRFYIAETVPAHQYKSEIAIDELTAQTPPDVDLPPAPKAKDPLVGTQAQTDARDWRFAVMSDAQFVARDPDSDIVKQARRTLREIKANNPDFLLINGDLVDEGSPEDLAFAHRMLDEELGDAVPWRYVPGNHEVMGGKIDNFVKEFGPAQQVFDHKGTRFLTLDTSSLTLRGGGYAQIQQLRKQLDAAADDPSVSSVTVVQHVPPRDPTPQKGSQLTDRKEADLLEKWLTDFQRRSGKGAAFIGAHVGTFDAARVDGVPYLINGNSGKNPATPPGEGGFTGWSMLGVDRVSAAEQMLHKLRPWRGGPDWVTAQVRPHVDGLALTVPGSVGAGASAKVAATVSQTIGSGSRAVPVAWPMSADWSGSPNVWVGDPERAPATAIAVYDPGTGELKGLRPGTGRLAVTVNGEVASQEVVVVR